MIILWIYLTGYILSVITLGVLHKKGIVDYPPNGDSEDMDEIAVPHVVICLIWFVLLAALIIFGVFYGIYKGIDKITDYLANVEVNVNKGDKKDEEDNDI